MKELFAILLALMIVFGIVSCKKESDALGSLIENIDIDSFQGSVSVGVCMTGVAGDFERELVNNFLELMLEKDFHIVINESNDEVAMVEDFVANGMDFVFFIGFGEENVDEIESICEEKGTYPVAYEQTMYDYSFSPLKKKDAKTASELLLKYLLGIIELGEEAPNVYVPKC